jgi:hypothetical protein
VEKQPLTPQLWLGEFNRAVSVAAPLFCLALCAVDSDLKSMRDQRAVIDDLLSLRKWNPSGRDVLVATPSGLAFVYHHILGAVLLDSGRRAEAVQLLTTRVRYAFGGTFDQMWREPEMMGWATSFNSNWTVASTFLQNLPQTQPWLMHFFVDDECYLIALRAYNFTASLLEMATAIASGGQQGAPKPERVPPIFAQGGELAAIMTAAVPDRQALETIARESNLDSNDLRRAWPAWCQAVVNSFGSYDAPLMRHMLRAPPELP